MAGEEIPWTVAAPRQTTSGPYVDAGKKLAEMLAPLSETHAAVEFPDLGAGSVSFKWNGLPCTLAVQRTPWPVPSVMGETRTMLATDTEQVIVRGSGFIQVILRRPTKLTITVTTLADNSGGSSDGGDRLLSTALENWTVAALEK